MRAGYFATRPGEKRRVDLIYPGGWRLKKGRSSKQLCENVKDGYPGRQAQPLNSELRAPHWNRRFKHSRSTRIVSELSRVFPSRAAFASIPIEYRRVLYCYQREQRFVRVPKSW